MVDDGVIVGKNGSFMAAWLYKGDDNASSTDEQREMVSLRINQALSGLGNGWMIHVDAVRRPAPNYPDEACPISRSGVGRHRRRTTAACSKAWGRCTKAIRADHDLFPAAACAAQIR